MANNIELNESITIPIQSEELGLMHPPPKRTRRGASSSTREQRGKCKDLLSLPNEMLGEILGFLDVRQLVQFSTVAKQFRVTFDHIFQIQTLEVIRLKFVDLGMPINDFQITGLRFLKVCSMNKLNINVVILNALLINCTKLEIVEIIDCNTPDRLRLSAGNLTKFRKIRLANCRALEDITINAPSLTTLHYSGQLITFNFEHCENFNDFLLDLKSTRWSNVYINHLLLDKLMSNLLTTEVLTTTSILVERLSAKFAKRRMTDMLYFFLMVKEINLTMERSKRCNLFVMAYFFRKFPVCERLFIDVRGWIQVN
ncbi:FBD-associated F-box protein At1g61320 [Linum grandiflorum]